MKSDCRVVPESSGISKITKEFGGTDRTRESQMGIETRISKGPPPHPRDPDITRKSQI